MRYRFVDRVVSLELGDPPRIEVVKTFDVADDALTGPEGPRRVPNSLVLELLAMTGGHLIFRRLGSSRLPLLMKIPEFRVERAARPGDRLSARAELMGLSDVADSAAIAETSGTVYQGATLVASGRLLYLCVSVPGVDLSTYENHP